MNSMAEFAKQLAAEAGKRGLRIVIEPINTTSEPTVAATDQPAETHEAKPVSTSTEAVSVPKIVSYEQKERAKQEYSWLTVSQCANMLNVSTSVIYNRIRSGIIPSRKNKYGVTTVNTNLLHGIPKSIGDRNGRSVPVRCIENGKCYHSMAQACRCLKVSIDALQRAIVHNEAANGYHFRLVDTED